MRDVDATSESVQQVDLSWDSDISLQLCGVVENVLLRLALLPSEVQRKQESEGVRIKYESVPGRFPPLLGRHVAFLPKVANMGSANLATSNISVCGSL